MIQLAALFAAYAAFALVYAADPGRLPAVMAARVGPPHRWSLLSRLAAAWFAGLAIWLACLVAPPAAGALFATTGAMVAGSAFVLAAPVWPRATWSLALLSPALVVVLALLGGYGAW